MNRRPLLARAEVHEAFFTFGRQGPTHGAWIGGFILMPDHLHLFVALADERLALSTFVKSLKNALSKALRLAGVSSPHWQKGFFDHVLRSSESYSQKWDYVRANPARAGLVTSPNDWPFQGEIHALEVRRS
jgi:REP element-mobilizing transposase RayT